LVGGSSPPGVASFFNNLELFCSPYYVAYVATILVYFQCFPLTLGNPARHVRDMRDYPDHRRTRRDDVFIEEALEIIRPRSKAALACRFEIKMYFGVLKMVQGDWASSLSPGEQRKKWRAVATTMPRALRALQALPASDALFRVSAESRQLPPDSQSTIAAMSHWAKAATLLSEHIKVRPGARPRHPTKEAAAACASDLLRAYAAKGPTMTTDGPYLRLAALLYEYASGESGTDLSKVRQTHVLKIGNVRP
jgi:hypothetical protein